MVALLQQYQCEQSFEFIFPYGQMCTQIQQQATH